MEVGPIRVQYIASRNDSVFESHFELDRRDMASVRTVGPLGLWWVCGAFYQGRWPWLLERITRWAVAQLNSQWTA